MPMPLPPHLRDVQEEMKGHAKNFGLEFFEKIYNLCLHGDVKGAGGFVADDKFRIHR